MLSVNLFEVTRPKCRFQNLSYFDKFNIAAATPLVILVLFFMYGCVASVCCPHAGSGPARRKDKRGRSRVARERSGIRRTADADAVGMAAAVKRRLFKGVAPWLSVYLNLYDLMYPLVCRTLLGYFTCRVLPPAGSFLEQDLSIQCEAYAADTTTFDKLTRTGKYDECFGLYTAIAFFYWAGTLALYTYLTCSQTMKDKIKLDATTHNMLGWLVDPYREGKEFWYVAPL